MHCGFDKKNDNTMYSLLCVYFFAVTLIGWYARAEYGAPCISPESMVGKCVPIGSCSNKNTSLGSHSDCGLLNEVEHVCCAEAQIQFNTAALAELKKSPCGKCTIHFVAGGKEVKPWSRPWMALLGYDRIDNEVFNCGGSLISDRFVLTAAHCVFGFEEDLKKIRLREHSIKNETDCIYLPLRRKCNKVIDVGIDKIFIHEEYKKGISYNDIALLRLKSPVEFDRFIAPICLPITKSLQKRSNELQEFFVSGWGITEDGQRSDVLLETRVRKSTLSTCSSVYQKEFRASQLCIGGDDINESCQGDSGGPLQEAGQYGNVIRMIQYGIVSYGDKRCGQDKGVVGVYTNVAYFIQWITDKMAS